MLKALKEFWTLQRFPDGRINFTGSKRAPVLNCFVEAGGRILLLKRSDKVAQYKGKWNCVGGYIDEDKPLHQKVLEELHEELGIKKDKIERIIEGEPYEMEDKNIGITWIIHPFLAKLKSVPNITLDFEHTEFRWVEAEQIKNYDTVLGIDKALRNLID